MIYATLIRVNKKDEDADILEPKDGSKTVRDLITLGSDASISMTLNATVKPLKTLTFPNKVALAHHASKTLNSLSTSKYAVLRHNDSDISKYRDIWFSTSYHFDKIQTKNKLARKRFENYKN